MNENRSNDGRSDRPGSKEAEPWHPADEKRAKANSSPIGTHSLTGGGAEVGMPAKPEANAGAERGERPSDAESPAQPDPLAEPRASIGEILGRKP
jgi:hypothetical protein